MVFGLQIIAWCLDRNLMQVTSLRNVRKSTDKSIVCSTACSENGKENFEAPPSRHCPFVMVTKG